MIKVGSASAKKGNRGQGFLKVGELSVHSEIQIPVLIVNGQENGSTLWVNGAVHGRPSGGRGTRPAETKRGFDLYPHLQPARYPMAAKAESL
jgi:hypothetical protein